MIDTVINKQLEIRPAFLSDTGVNAEIPENLDPALSVKSDNVEKNEAITISGNQDPVGIPLPKSPVDPDNMYELLALVQQILNGSCDANSQAKAGLQAELSSVRVKNLSEAIDQINKTKQDWSNGMQDLDDKTALLEAADRTLSDTNGKVKSAQADLDAVTAQLAQRTAELQRNPGDDATKEKYQAAVNSVNVSQQALDQAKTEQSTAAQNLASAYAAAADAADATLAAKAKMDLATNDYQSIQNNGLAYFLLNTDDTKSAMQQMIELISVIGEILKKNEMTKLQNSNSLNEDLQKSRIEKCKQLVAEYQKAVKDAEEAQKKSSRIGRIISGIVTGLAVAAAPFSGGLSIVAAGISVAVFTADCVLDAKGLMTASEALMVPVQKGLIEPLSKALVGQIILTAKMLGKDISQEDAEIVAGVMATAIVFAAATAVSVAGANKLATTKVFGETFSKVMNFSLKGMNPSTMRIAFGVAQTVTQLSNSGFQAYMDVQIASSQAEGKNAEGDMTLMNAEMAILKTIIQQCVDHFCKADTSYELTKKVSNILSELNSSGNQVARNIAA